MQVFINIKIAHSLFNKSNEMTNIVLCEAAGEFDEVKELPSFDEVLSSVIAESADRANIGVTLEGERLCLTINDEVFVKYFNVYLKVIKTVAPFIRPCINLFKTLKSDVSEIADFINARN